MRLLAVLTATGLAMTGGAAHAASVSVKDAVARVVVIPEARSDIKVEFLTTNPSLPISVRQMGDRVIVDGDLERKIRSCNGEGEGASVDVAGIGRIAYADMPQLVIRTPREANVGAAGAVFGSVGKSASLDLASAGCGDWTVANVEGRLKLSQAGSGDVRTGSAGDASVRVAGSGDVNVQAVRGGLSVDVAGSGNVTAASIHGPLDVKVAGSGDVRVSSGRASSMAVTIAGSGNVTFDGQAGSLKARIAGSGDVRARQVTGGVSKQVMGSGDVTIG